MASLLAARRLPLATPERFDVVLALFVAGLALVDVVAERPAERAGIAVFAALGTTLPIAWRSVAPGAAALVATLSLGVAVALGSPHDQPTVTGFAPLIVLFALGEHGTTQALTRAGPACILAWTSFGLFQHDAGATLLGFCGSIGAIAVGRAVRVMDSRPRCSRRRWARFRRTRSGARGRLSQPSASASRASCTTS
jgi:hypothetical protein